MSTSIPATTADLATTWLFLKEKIEDIMTGRQQGLSFTQYGHMYTAVHNYCSASGNLKGSALYNELLGYLVEHLKCLCDQSSTLHDEDLLRYYTAEWDRYTRGARYLNGAFTSLNRYWVKSERDEGRISVYPVYTLALVQWKRNFFSHLQSLGKLTDAILCQIEHERNGDMIDRGLVKKAIDSFIALGLDNANVDNVCLDVYVEHLEAPLIEATERHYKQYSDSFLAEKPVSDYLRQAEECLKEEHNRAEQYLNIRTRKALISTCERILIREHANALRGSFCSLLDLDDNEGLQRIYLLFLRIHDGVGLLRLTFEEHIKKTSLLAVSALVKPGKSKLSALDHKTYVDVLFEIHQRNSEIVAKCFGGDIDFTANLKAAFGEIVNCNPITDNSNVKAPELLVTCVDMHLRRNNEMTQEDFKDIAKRVMTLSEYIKDKDVFQEFYALRLSHRLIHGLAGSDEAEEYMISELSPAHGFHYDGKLKNMLNDICNSKSLTEQFKQQMVNNHHDIGFDFHVKVLRTNSWPLDAPNSNLVIPAVMGSTCDQFQQYFQQQYSGRKLTWLWNYSKAELETNYLSQKYILKTSADQAAVLLQYNNNNILSFGDLVAATAIEKQALVHILLELTQAKIVTSVGTDQYQLNLMFWSDNTNVNLDVKRPITREKTAVMDKERQYDLMIMINYTIKRAETRTMKQQELLQRVITQCNLKKIKPNIPEIKKAIELCLEKEYIERVDGTRDMFRYVP